jgi:hypothetical protein
MLRTFRHLLAGAEYVIPLLLNPERVVAFVEDVTRQSGREAGATACR